MFCYQWLYNVRYIVNPLGPSREHPVMNTIDLQHTQSPVDLMMPYTPQLITTAIYGVGAAAFVMYALYLTYRNRSALPVLFVFGALLTIFLEPVVDLLGNAVHPQIGQLNVLTTNGHAVPLVVLVGYVWYFAAAPLVSFRQITKRTLTRGFVWKTFTVIVLGAATVEQIPLYYGLWVYYGAQPVKIGFMPIWWIFANTAAVMVPLILIYALFPVLKGWRQLLVVPIIPMGAFMGHTGAGWPTYNVLGTETEQVHSVLLQLAGASSVALSLLIVWVMMEVAGIARRAPVGQAPE
jgi:hypothetical protein